MTEADVTIEQKGIEMVPLNDESPERILTGRPQFWSVKRCIGLLIIVIIVACVAIIAAMTAARLYAPSGTASSSAPSLNSISQFTASMQRQLGVFPVYLDNSANAVYLEVSVDAGEFLYSTAFSSGLGLRDLFLDRGVFLKDGLVRFELVGLNRVLLIQRNYQRTSTSSNPASVLTATESFPESVLYGFAVKAFNASAATALIDVTDFLLRDQVQHISTRLASQGSFSLDLSRSRITSVKCFRRNIEVEVLLTLTSSAPGANMRDLAPDASSVSVSLHRQFLPLPALDGSFQPRVYDPRAGVYPQFIFDYTSPLGADVIKRVTQRWRLHKSDVHAKLSDAVTPIVFHVDSGIPEPIRSAVLDGVGWWSQAFEAAGFRNAFRAELLPADADPDDARYNVVEWVHRQSRGYSMGQNIVDPRTGEILRGHVTLGSLRARQDWVIAEGFFSPYTNGSSDLPADNALLDLVLARIRQLAAHEVGHALGLKHNFAASTNERASVMDYPAPLLTVLADNVTLSSSNAYATNIGEWDTIAIRYMYEQFVPGADEAAELRAILHEAFEDGLRYITDEDSNVAGSPQPQSNVWDNGVGVVQGLQQEMLVRKLSLDRIGIDAIPASSLHG
eukprot:TRINITY_DN944_c0_g1_i11.p1 TRINITY_DN944_c0_g1~~TRINITY_DN944_c0_g1_i11.p1  ORF type:complete len:630 (+),score=90.75 TRINITY_DN944_c0_g1_i11:34-1890(+)